MTAAERVYRLALHAYPAGYRGERGPEILATLARDAGHAPWPGGASGCRADRAAMRAREAATTGGTTAGMWAEGSRLAAFVLLLLAARRSMYVVAADIWFSQFGMAHGFTPSLRHEHDRPGSYDGRRSVPVARRRGALPRAHAARDRGRGRELRPLLHALHAGARLRRRVRPGDRARRGDPAAAPWPLWVAHRRPGKRRATPRRGCSCCRCSRCSSSTATTSRRSRSRRSPCSSSGGSRPPA